jgi:hypothetical protein
MSRKFLAETYKSKQLNMQKTAFGYAIVLFEGGVLLAIRLGFYGYFNRLLRWARKEISNFEGFVITLIALSA